MGPDEEFVPHTNTDEDMEDVVPSATDRSAEDVVRATLDKLLNYTHIADKYVPPNRSWTCEEDLKDAARMRQHMEAPAAAVGVKLAKFILSSLA